MAVDDLGIKQRAALLALMVEAREISNPELEEIAGFRLSGKELDKLKDLKLVDSYKDSNRRNTLVHSLTDDGWAWCAREMAAARPLARGAGSSAANALSLVLRGLGRFLDRAALKPADVFGSGEALPSQPAHVAQPTPLEHARIGVPGDPEEVISRIREGYRRLAGRPGEWVSLTALRPLLGADLSRGEVDAVLLQMSRAGQVNLVPQSNQKVLTDADRQAAIRIGDQDNHLMSIEEP